MRTIAYDNTYTWTGIVCLLMHLVLISWPALPSVGREYHTDACVPSLPSKVEVEVVGDERGCLPLIYNDRTSRWESRFFQGTVEAKMGERYSLRIRNCTNDRIGLVIAVDGRNIISGNRSYLRPSESMYVLNPFQIGVFKGWRTGLSRENRFYFTTAEDSYAGAWGDTARLGTIEVAVFQERFRPRCLKPFSSPPWEDGDRDKVPAPLSSLQKSQAGRFLENDSRPGTGYGEEVYSRVREIDFETEDFPCERWVIRYEWPGKYRLYEKPPRYIPEEDRSGFAPPPPSKSVR